MGQGQVCVRGQESLAEEEGLSNPDSRWGNHVTAPWVSFLVCILKGIYPMFFQGSVGSEKFCDVREGLWQESPGMHKD